MQKLPTIYTVTKSTNTLPKSLGLVSKWDFNLKRKNKGVQAWIRKGTKFSHKAEHIQYKGLTFQSSKSHFSNPGLVIHGRQF